VTDYQLIDLHTKYYMKAGAALWLHPTQNIMFMTKYHPLRLMPRHKNITVHDPARWGSPGMIHT